MLRSVPGPWCVLGGRVLAAKSLEGCLTLQEPQKHLLNEALCRAVQLHTHTLYIRGLYVLVFVLM